MSREIKFRAFFKYDSQDGKSFMADLDNVEIDICIKDGDPVMQYTGLKDKNGVEICEGDIVHIRKDKFGEGRHEVWTVEYSESNAAFICFNQLNSDRPISGDCSVVTCKVTPDYEFELVVIGNIYENPELVTQHDIG